MYFEGLNLLRFVSAMMILIFHSLITNEDAPFGGLINNFDFGVDFFFIISGFLITYLLLLEKLKYLTIGIKAFYLRRIFRIFPLYYLLVLVSFLTFRGHTNMNINYAPHLCFWGNFEMIRDRAWTGGFLTPLWSLCVEEHFYWIVPFLVLLCPLKWIKYLYGFIILLSLASKYYFSVQIPDNWFYINCHTLSKMDVIAIGGLIACFHFQSPIRFHLSPWFSALALLTTMTLMNFVDFSNYSTVNRAMFGRYLIYLPFTLFFCLFVFNDHPALVRIKKNRALDYLGSISYGIYMFQMIVLFCISPWIPHASFIEQVIFVTIASAITIAFAAISYRYIEAPFLRLKGRFERVKTQASEEASELLVKYSSSKA